MKSKYIASPETYYNPSEKQRDEYNATKERMAALATKNMLEAGVVDTGLSMSLSRLKRKEEEPTAPVETPKSTKATESTETLEPAKTPDSTASSERAGTVTRSAEGRITTAATDETKASGKDRTDAETESGEGKIARELLERHEGESTQEYAKRFIEEAEARGWVGATWGNAEKGEMKPGIVSTGVNYRGDSFVRIGVSTSTDDNVASTIYYIRNLGELIEGIVDNSKQPDLYLPIKDGDTRESHSTPETSTPDTAESPAKSPESDSVKPSKLMGTLTRAAEKDADATDKHNEGITTREKFGLPKGFITEKGSRYIYTDEGHSERFKFDGTYHEPNGLAIFLKDELESRRLLDRVYVTNDHIPKERRNEMYVITKTKDGKMKIVYDIVDIEDPDEVYYAMIDGSNRLGAKVKASITPEIGSFVFEIDHRGSKILRHPGHRVTEITA